LRGRSGAVLRADRLCELVDRVAARVAGTQAKGGVPLLAQCLQIDKNYGDPAAGGAAVVHFVCFWRALDAVWQRLREGDEDADREPLAAEAAAFRDVLLARSSAGSLAPASFMEELTSARKVSSDQPAWAPLEAVARQTLELKEEAVATKPLRLDIVSTLLLVWLQEVVEDYRRGERAEKIRNVRDVLRCKVHEACEHLGASGWDIEAALRRFYIGAAPLAARDASSLGGAWSSQSAKLRSKEVQCPICVQDFRPGTESLVTRCCFQVICVHCVASLTSAEGELRCPFCRCAKVSPNCADGDGESRQRREDDFFTEVFRAAGTYCAKQADHLTKEFMAALQHAEAGPQYDLRLDVVLGAPGGGSRSGRTVGGRGPARAGG